MTARPPLAAHQKEAIDWIRRVKRGLLADEPGLGKSRVAVEAFDGMRTLVVAPAMVIDGGTWSDEISKWADHPESFTVAPFSRINDREKTKNGGTRPVKRPRPEYAGPWDAIVVDEAHYTKGRGTSWTQVIRQLTKTTPYVLEMTGTPMPNWAHELFTILQAIYPDRSKPGEQFGSYWRWVAQWFRVSASFYNPEAREIGGLLACTSECARRPANDPCEHWLEFTHQNLGDRYLRRLRDEVLTSLPPLTEQSVETAMSATQKRQYRELKHAYLTHSDSGAELVAWTNGAKNVMLDKLTTSAWLLDPKGEPQGGKFDRLRFDLANRSRPTLVLAHYRDTTEACQRVAAGCGARAAFIHGGTSKRDRAARVAAFKNGGLDVLVGSLETVSEGLTLTAADMAIFVETSYKPSRNEQAKRRIHRIGQTRPVTVLNYVTPGTVDARKWVLLASKTDQQMRCLSAAEFARLL